MKKIINKKRYDTDKATKIGVWNNGYSRSDFNYCAETLYKKRTGEYFLHCEGHALSPYGVPCGNGSVWGELIKPLTYVQAQNWAIEKLDADLYENEFGVIKDDDEAETITIRLQSCVAEKFRRMAAKESLTLGELLNKLIKDK